MPQVMDLPFQVLATEVEEIVTTLYMVQGVMDAITEYQVWEVEHLVTEKFQSHPANLIIMV